MRVWLWRILLSSAGLAAAYVFGAWSFANDAWPIHALRSVKRASIGQGELTTRYDAFGRLIAWGGKTQIACPVQDDRTAVILFIGQSNQANEAGQRMEAPSDARVAAWFDGACTVAASPLLGATGAKGEPLTPLGVRLVESDLFRNVVLVPSAIGGTKIERWGAGGDLNAMLGRVVDDVQKIYRITHVVWHQGEDDFRQDTGPATYRRRFLELEEMLRSHNVGAPILISVATRCDDDSKWSPDNSIAQAQRALVDEQKGVYAGVDTDALLLPVDRYDECHLGASGVDKYADGLAEALRRLP